MHTMGIRDPWQLGGDWEVPVENVTFSRCMARRSVLWLRSK